MVQGISLKSKIDEFIQKYYYILYFALLFVLAFCCFFKLGTAAIADWDEARHGVNAYEMLRENNLVANYYGDSLDYWNLKPPISYYFVMLGYKLFGYNAFGLRFFSALSYVLVGVVISLFLKKNYGKTASLLSLFVLISFCFLFISHCIRTGDADSIYLLFFTVAVVSLLSTKNNPYWIFLTGFTFALMFLTKSWHSLVFVPIVFFYLIFTKGFKRIGWWKMILFFVFSLAPIAVWVLLRYNIDGTKFFEEMINYDLLSRSSTALEDHNEIFIYYFLYLAGCAFPTIFASVLIIVNKVKSKQKPSYDEIGAYVSFACILVMFTFAQTKLAWYIFPCIIPLTIFVSANLPKIEFKAKWKAPKIIAIVSLGIFSLVSIGYPFFVKNNNDVQNFINNVTIEEVYGADLYYQNDGDTSWSQGNFLCAELKLDSHPKSGGWSSFASSANSYLIIDNASLDTEKLALVEILYQDENFSLCKLL